jgi:hypothetical protein
MKRLCRYRLDFYRFASLEGVFVLTDDEFAAIQEMDGREVQYGEVAGKHSDVHKAIIISKLEILSDKEEEIAFFERILPEGVGFDFKKYWFNTDLAYDEGYQEGNSSFWKDAQEAISDYPKHNNSVMRDAFYKGFNNARERKKVSNIGGV